MYSGALLKLRPHFLLVPIVIFGFLAVDQERNLPAEREESRIQGEGKELVTRLAPGEFLPISVELTNYGGGDVVDVLITYRLLDENDAIMLTINETIPVETSTRFTKVIQIPDNMPPGKYVVESSIVYEGQDIFSVSNYKLSIERKIAGIFVSQFIIYGILTLLIGIEFIVIHRLLVKKRQRKELAIRKYPVKTIE